MSPHLVLMAFAAGVFLGAGVAFAFARLRWRERTLRATAEANEKLAAVEAERRVETERRVSLEARTEELLRARADVDKQLAVAEERVAKAGELIAEQQRFAESTKRDLESSFKALAAAALAGNNEQFLTLAEQRLATVRAETEADIEQKKQGIEQLLAPLKETLGKLEQRTGDIEQQRVHAYAKLEQHVSSLAQTTAMLSDKTTALATALKGSSQARGQWGEMVLRSVAEAAGMLEHCDFEVQATQDDGKRPDMVVKLPGGRAIAVDAKVPLSAYYEAAEATRDDAREEALARHVIALKKHVLALRQRDYAKTLASELDLVVLFLPGDPILSAAFAKEPALQAEALRHKVLITTPTTLVALLRTVAIYWQQRAMAENAEAIAHTARELYDRAAKFSDDLGKIGKGLRSAITAYNEAMGSFEWRFLPMAKRLQDMKVTGEPKREVTAPATIEELPRESRLIAGAE